MKTYFECLACFVRQTTEVLRSLTDDQAIQEQVLRRVLRVISEIDFRQPPPKMAQLIHREIKTSLGQEDPYKDLKRHFTSMALEMYPEIKARVNQAQEPETAAVQVCIAANVIDLGAKSHLNQEQVEQEMMSAVNTPVQGNMQELFDELARAERILYLADNAGEIVFDRLLLERMPREKVIVVVKGSPVINDAVMADAQMAGINDLVEVTDNGSDVPGTILPECSEEFRRLFAKADLVLAKGQGNYETLNLERKSIFFLLKAKCPVIAESIGCQVGDFILTRTLSAKKSQDVQLNVPVRR